MQHLTQDSTSRTCLWPSKQVWQILFSKKMSTIFFFLQKTYWATIMSRDNKTHILQCSVTKMHFPPVVHTFLYSHNTFLSEFTKISSIPDHMWQGHLIVPGQQNNVPGRMKLLFWAKSAVKRYWFVPDIPRILYKTLLAQYGLPYIDIFTQKYILPQQKRIFAKCPGRTKIEKSK